MKLFDLHCDTLFELDKLGKNLDTADLNVSLNGMKKYDKCIRAFAVFTPDELKESQAVSHFEKLYTVFKNQLNLFSDSLSDFENGVDNDKIEMLLTVENASVLAGNINNIERLSQIGVKVLSLTWNGENQLGFGQLNNKGLKTFGKECIPVLEENGITVDVSHISDKGFEDICSLSTKPFIATHSNCRKICNHRRNLTDEQIKEIIKRKGIIGLNFYEAFLNNNPDEASGYDILKHIEHILSLGGEDAISVGTDFDGAQIISEFNSDEKLNLFSDFLISNGVSNEISEKITYKNAFNFFSNRI